MSNHIWLSPACACWSLSWTICIIKKRNVLKYFPRFRTKSSSAVSPEQNPATSVWQPNNPWSVTRHAELSGMCSHIPKSWTHLSSTISNLSFFLKPAIWFLSGHKRGKEGDTTVKETFVPSETQGLRHGWSQLRIKLILFLTLCVWKSCPKAADHFETAQGNTSCSKDCSESPHSTDSDCVELEAEGALSVQIFPPGFSCH